MTTTAQTDCGESGTNGATEAMRRVSIIGKQNDRYRSTLNGDAEIKGKIVTTPGIRENGPDFLMAALRAVRDFKEFSSDNDPYNEHEFGSVEVMGIKIFWKIDIYDAAYEFGSSEPADPSQSRRVLTLMLPIEY
ncbi:DUF3768 domain-containing protein [Pelagibius sp. Alg239-R121]|uniref:DUF3768 domain-containing protein n=1 Tax=Pelagibius sp. Alg239-R121 TaxID=2993448 RepID=UPI0024A758E3|nr:DUF3768 domain-containing protein [Pelagibius sp. Alg239-R121]